MHFLEAETFSFARLRQITQQNAQGGPKKRRHRLMTIILSNVNRFQKFTGRFPGKFAVKCILKIPAHFAYVATLPCETLMSAKQALDHKLQGSVAAYLTCGGVVNNQIKNGLLLSLGVKSILNSVNIWQSYEQNVIVSCTFIAF